MYDEAWSLIANISDMMRRTSGGNVCNFDVLAWHIDPRKDESGFSPHRDRQPEDVSQTFRKDGSAKYTTCWIALTDATPENSCLYMLPRFCDPGYIEGDDMEEEEEKEKKKGKEATEENAMTETATFPSSSTTGEGYTLAATWSAALRLPF